MQTIEYIHQKERQMNYNNLSINYLIHKKTVHKYKFNPTTQLLSNRTQQNN